MAKTIKSLLKVLVYRSLDLKTGIDNPLANKPTRQMTECRIPAKNESTWVNNKAL